MIYIMPRIQIVPRLLLLCRVRDGPDSHREESPQRSEDLQRTALPIPIYRIGTGGTRPPSYLVLFKAQKSRHYADDKAGFMIMVNLLVFPNDIYFGIEIC